MNVEEFLSRLERVKRSGDGWVARCPAHEDRNPSLSINEGDDGRLLVRCHAGCSFEAIMAAVGAEPARAGDPEAVYPYVDEEGRLLFEVVRLPGKRFAQRRADGSWGLGTTRRVLFRLPQVLAAIERGETVYVCEGEKDVLAAERCGVVATTNPHGAGKWKPAYTETLRGAARVVVVADKDLIGEAHAHEIAGALGEMASVVLPKVGKDLADHLAAGLTLDEFVPLLVDVPHLLRLYHAVTGQRAEFVWPGLVPRRMVTVLAGEQGLGKSLWTVHVAAELSKQGKKTVLVSAEDSPEFVTKWRIEAALGDDELIADAEVAPVFGNGSDDQWFGIVRAWSVWADLIVLDPVMAFLDMKMDSYRAQHVRHLIAGLQKIIEETDCALIFLMHLTKGEGTNPLKRVNGAGAWTEAARSVLLMTPATTTQEPERILSHVKCNVSEKAQPQLWEVAPILLPSTLRGPISTARLEYRGIAEGVDVDRLLASRDSDNSLLEDDDAERFLRLALSAGPRKPKDVLREAADEGISRATVYRAKLKLSVVSDGAGSSATWLLSHTVSRTTVSQSRETVGETVEPASALGLEAEEATVSPYIRARETVAPPGPLGVSQSPPDLGTASLADLAAWYEDPT